LEPDHCLFLLEFLGTCRLGLGLRHLCVRSNGATDDGHVGHSAPETDDVAAAILLKVHAIVAALPSFAALI
jgi:hypothetical protein